MTGQHGPTPTDAAATIAELQAEIERLEERVKEDRFAADLRAALTKASAVGTIAAPIGYDKLLHMIVATAADIVDADAAALFLFDAHHNLTVEAAFGEEVNLDRNFCIPPDQGVVGMVAMTGQPMAISDADDEVREHAFISQALGYAPTSLLCVPLSFHDRVIGVLGVMDKKGATFSAGDLEATAVFAHLAAVAIEQYRTETKLSALLVDLVRAAEGVPVDDGHALTDGARTFSSHLSRQTGYLSALELAELLQEVVQHGDVATEACRGILTSFVHFLRSRPGPEHGPGAMGW